jgi:hypothetical protein
LGPRRLATAYDEVAGMLEYDECIGRRKAEALARTHILALRGTLNGLKTTKLDHQAKLPTRRKGR